MAFGMPVTGADTGARVVHPVAHPDIPARIERTNAARPYSRRSAQAGVARLARNDWPSTVSTAMTIASRLAPTK